MINNDHGLNFWDVAIETKRNSYSTATHALTFVLTYLNASLPPETAVDSILWNIYPTMFVYWLCMSTSRWLKLSYPRSMARKKSLYELLRNLKRENEFTGELNERSTRKKSPGYCLSFSFRSTLVLWVFRHLKEIKDMRIEAPLFRQMFVFFIRPSPANVSFNLFSLTTRANADVCEKFPPVLWMSGIT